MLCLLMPVDADAGKLYRWVDADGNVHYTDRLPADASDNAHRVMDERGTVMEAKESSKVERQRQRQREAGQAEEKRRAEQEKRRAEEQRKSDRIIQQTFSTERDIELTRQNRVEAVQVQINIAEHGIRRLETRREHLVQLLDKLPEDSPAAEVHHKRIAEIDAQLEQRQANRTRLEDQHADIEALFDRYLERFRELKE